MDLNAAVRAMIDVRRGNMPDPRINIRITHQIRDLAVVVLMELSESTNEKVGLSTRMGAALRYAAANPRGSAWCWITDGEPADIDERDLQCLRHDSKKAVEDLRMQGIQLLPDARPAGRPLCGRYLPREPVFHRRPSRAPDRPTAGGLCRPHRIDRPYPDSGSSARQMTRAARSGIGYSRRARCEPRITQASRKTTQSHRQPHLGSAPT